MSANPMPASNLLADLTAIVGQAHVLTSDADREFYAMDVYNQLKHAAGGGAAGHGRGTAGGGSHRDGRRRGRGAPGRWRVLHGRLPARR